jgi:hypothetical protein
MSHLAQDQDESILIAAKALGDMRNAALIHSPTLHPPSLSCAYLSPLTPHVLTLLYSHSAHTCPLCGLFIQFPNSDHPYARIRGSCHGL